MPHTTRKVPVVFLGPAETTFSWRAWGDAVGSRLFPLPDQKHSDFTSVSSNEEVLPAMLKHPGSYGIIAVKSRADGRVVDSFDSLVDVGVRCYGTTRPFNIIGAMSMRLSFALMTRWGVDINHVAGVIGHRQALGACAKNIARWMFETERFDSNGLAAEAIACNDEYKRHAALGPIEAARKHKLQTIDDAFEDAPAYTTFYLLGPEHAKAEIEVGTGVQNRALVVFRTHDHAGALHDVLGLFKEGRINLKHLHSVDETEEVCDFVCEAHVAGTQLEAFSKATRDMRELKLVRNLTVFGPFSFRTIKSDEYSWPI